jgi:DNA polymerase-3 subunit gamma/tau
MGYQVLARKYRPQRFADVAGQDHVTRTLMNALSQNRIAHGYIFSGIAASAKRPSRALWPWR